MPSSAIPKITLEQWAAFKSVVDEGSFARAGEALNKSPSSISYLIARLNDQLPTPALAVMGRKAELTEAGTVLYRHATTLLEQASACEKSAAFLASGWETQLTLVCDALVPIHPVLCALQSFSAAGPLTRIKILETSLSGTDEAVLNRECDLAIMPRVPPGFLAEPLANIKMVAVAQRDHPLAALTQVSEAELKTHRQIVVRDTGIKREQDAGWLGAEQRWTVSHFATSLEMVSGGLGFAFLPEHRITDSERSGNLVRLPLEMGAERQIPLSLVLTDSGHSGPAARKLMAELRTAFAKSGPIKG